MGPSDLRPHVTAGRDTAAAAPALASHEVSTAASTSSPVISLTGVSHAFAKKEGGGTIVLDKVSLDVPAGQFLALVGPSGCGKTTILNMVAGLLEPLTGSVTVTGEAVNGPNRHTGYMFARDGLLPWRTAIANVEVGLVIRGMRREARRERAREMLELVGLDQFEHSYPRQLSQGMRQRAAIARTLAPDPEILLMDEPFGALDAQTRIKVQAEFLNIWQGSGKTVLFVTHDLGEAVLLADRVVVFTPRPGRIIRDVIIDLPRPRDIDTLRFDERYEHLHAELWQSLKEGTVV